MTTYSLIVTFREGTGATWKGLTRARCRKLVQSAVRPARDRHHYHREETMNAETIKGYTVNGRIGGFAISYTRRRYHGHKTFTWVEYYNGTDWVSLGDPWPSASLALARTCSTR